ncbi:hypothetical protein BGZ61DRAFT_124365 [Ilyonectria robusta]|uniref:uncharacterized protein n=1 Tax=Ilyonectria robusta TaxID=1079257 RepID=UPI001E8EC874|nr:uncharacterized protein BGZ61DRAFT_124365 [Ilyonectria robusta]KAH8734416.1 hypothetical protein BGZ61DRAFT_124365 [Ilyonectria robusta]
MAFCGLPIAIVAVGLCLSCPVEASIKAWRRTRRQALFLSSISPLALPPPILHPALPGSKLVPSRRLGHFELSRVCERGSPIHSQLSPAACLT